jgi:hypothetical protein
VIAGPLAGALGAPAVLAAGGAIVVLLPILILLIPEVRHMQRNTPAALDAETRA